jgi:hypothetical protein
MIADLPLAILTHTLPEAWIATLQGKCQLEIGPQDATFLAPALEALLPQVEGLFCL